MSYIVLDVESDNRCPANGSMVCFGAVLVSDTTKTFYGKTRPITDTWNEESLAVSGFSREEHEQFEDPKEVMERFEKWILEVSVGRPIFISDNPCLKYSTRIKVTDEFNYLPSYLKRNKTVTIYDIVKNKINYKIPSYNFKKNTIELKNIIGWSDNNPKDKWVTLKTDKNNNFTSYTENHKIYTKENGYVEAKDLKSGDTLIKLGIHPNNDQEQLILGSLMGDGSFGAIYKGGRNFTVGHSILSYTKFKYDILGDLCFNKINRKNNNRGYSKKDGILYQFYTKTLPFLLDYDKGENIFNIVNALDYRGLSIWYMDDGSLLHDSIVRLHTEGLGFEKNIELSKLLSTKTNLNWKVIKFGRGNYGLTLSIKDSYIFTKEILPYMCDTMLYKIPSKLRQSKEKYIWNNKSILNTTESKIVEVKIIENQEVKRYRKRNYCITIEDNNNFFTTNGLVHNCFDWQWINYYFWKYLDRNPFGHSGRRIGDLYCGMVMDASKNAEWKRKLKKTKHTHHPIDDSMGVAEALIEMQKMGLKVKF